MLVQVYKKIRKLKDWTPYQLAKSLKISQTQLKHYEDQPVSTREMLLVRLQRLSGLSVQDFWDLLEKEVDPADKERIKKRIE